MLGASQLDYLRSYCREPIDRIKGYEEAIASSERYECHHINELTFTKDELKKMNMYYNRPASELVLLTISEHRRLQNQCKHWNWKGDSAKFGAKYRRALRAFRKGLITEDELVEARSLRMEERRMEGK